MNPARSTTAAQPSSCTLVVARTLDECEQLRREWERFPRTPGSDLDRLRERLTVDTTAIRPHVVLLRRDGVAEAMLVGLLEHVHLTAKVGYRRLYQPLVRSLTVSPGGAVGDLSSANADELVRCLWSSLREGEAGVAMLRELPAASALADAARTTPPLRCRDHLTDVLPRWIARFPESPDTPFPQSGHARRHVRYYENRLRRRHGEHVVVHSRLPLETLVRDVDEVAAKSYQRQIGVGFRDDPATRRQLAFENASGVLRSWVLYVEGRPAAFWLGLRYGDTYYSGDTAYDPELREFRPGEILLVRAMSDLREEGVRVFDFGLGDADYKRRYADRRVDETTVAMFAPTAQGVLRNLGRTTVGGTNRFLKTVARRLELFDRLRSNTRRRLIEKS